MSHVHLARKSSQTNDTSKGMLQGFMRKMIVPELIVSYVANNMQTKEVLKSTRTNSTVISSNVVSLVDCPN